MIESTELALHAFNERPIRAEPLYDLAKHFREKGWNHASLLFSEAGLVVDRPDDSLFVEDNVYRWGFREEFSICAYYSDEHRGLGRKVCNDLALDRGVPEQTRDLAWSNLFFYTRPLAEQAPSFRSGRLSFDPPAGWRPMNPSVCRLRDRMFLNVRTVNYLIGQDGRYQLPQGHVATRNWLLALNDDMSWALEGEVLLPSGLPDPLFRECVGFEDLRLFPRDDDLWVSGTTRQLTAEGWADIVTARIASTGELVDWHVMEPQNPRRYEKNWIPVIGRDEFIYSIDPFRVVDFQGRVRYERVPPVALDKCGGSTQAIPFDDGFLVMVHERIAVPGLGQRRYQRRFLMMDQDLNLTAVSDRFYFGDGEGEFSCGMCLHPDGKRLVIPYGVLDREAWVATVDLDDVRRMVGSKLNFNCARIEHKLPSLGIVRSDPPIELFVTDTGRWWLPTNAPRDQLVNEIRAGRVYDAEVLEEARKHIRPGTVVLDVGSSFGQMAVLFSRMVGHKGAVHAFEANPFAVSVLRRNLTENADFGNVFIHDGAAWDKSNLDLRFPEPDLKRFDSHASYGIDPNAREGRIVRSIAIDDLHINQPISFMKVDAQGSDLRVMQGARETIRKHRMPIIFEFEALFQGEFGTSLEDYMRFVDEIGYSVASVINGVNYVILPDNKIAPEIAPKISPVSWIDEQINRPLRHAQEYEEAHKRLLELGLPTHRDRPKDWDNLMAVSLAAQFCRKTDLIMDAGGNHDSAFLPGLQRLGHKCLMCLNLEYDAPCFENGITFTGEDITDTRGTDEAYAFVACLSVLEHGVDWRKFLTEMSRIIRPGGHLFVSFDYWESKIDCGDRMAFGAPVKVFDHEEVSRLIFYAKNVGFGLVGNHDLRCRDKVINWIGLDFTFMNLLFRRTLDGRRPGNVSAP